MLCVNQCCVNNGVPTTESGDPTAFSVALMEDTQLSTIGTEAAWHVEILSIVNFHLR